LKLVNGLVRRVSVRGLGSLQDLRLSIVIQHESANPDKKQDNENDPDD
jgi:hypothetical protein